MLAALALAIAAVSGCGSTTVDGSATVPSPTGNIRVEAHIEGPGSVWGESTGTPPNVTVKFGSDRNVVVEADRILLDGKPYRVVPAGTKKIYVDVAKGKVTIKADDKPLSE